MSQLARSSPNGYGIWPIAEASLIEDILSLLHLAARHKQIKKGMNEIEKALRRSNGNNNKQVRLVVLAHDTEPIAIAQGFARQCEDADVPWVYVPSRVLLGRAVGVVGGKKGGGGDMGRGVVAVGVLGGEGSEIRGMLERVRLEVERLAL